MKIAPKALKSEVTIPPSKSESHRAIICASLAKGKSIVRNIRLSHDAIATIEAMKALGALISILEKDENKNSVVLEIQGIEKPLENLIIDCNESGSTLRFLIPIAATISSNVTFLGQGRLPLRPLDVYFEIFHQHNILYKRNINSLPLNITGNLKSGTYELDGGVSSQFITGIMLATAFLDGQSVVKIKNKLESKPYINITQDIMGAFGAKTSYKENEYIVYGGGYKPADFTVMGDWSHVAFFLLAGTYDIIKINGLDKNSKQGDIAIIDILNSMGAKIYWEGDVLVSEKAELTSSVVDVSQCPDLAPAIAGAMAIANGQSKIVGGSRLKIKESDRIQSIVKTINSLGGDAKATDDGMIINGVKSLKGSSVDSFNDHRIAMMVGALSPYCVGEINLSNSEAVEKSYPDFWTDFVKLGGCILE